MRSTSSERYGELQSLVALDALVPLDLASELAGRGISDALLTLGKLGTLHQLCMPWMQASYIMVTNKQALSYLPSGGDRQPQVRPACDLGKHYGRKPASACLVSRRGLKG